MCQLWALHVVTKRQFFYIYLHINESLQVGALAVRFNKFITSVGYLTARENEVQYVW